jgi:hypothetical protein
MGIRRGSISTPIIVDGLVFNMDPANRASYPRTGTIITNTISNQNGTFHGSPTFQNDFNGVIDFDGTDDYIDTNFNTDSDYISFIFWAYRDAGVNDGTYLSRWGIGSNWSIIVREDSSNNLKIQFQCSNGNAIANADMSLSTGDWNCYAATFDGTIVRIYKNGIQNTTQNLAGVLKTGTPDLFIGDRTTLSQSPFNGQIGAIQIYNRALSSTEVAQNYNALKGRFGL